MNKEQILARIDELDAEAAELKAEQEAIDYLLTTVAVGSSRYDEMMHHIERRNRALEIRISKWEREVNKLDEMTRCLEKAA